MTMCNLSLALEPITEENVAAIGAGLKAYNDAQRETSGRSEFAVTVRTPDDNTIIGGAKCKIGEGMLFIEWLWIDDNARGGTGTRVMAMAESHALAQGCTKAYLDTFNFQARGFYEKLGYEVFGTLTFPGGAIERHYMCKDLVPPHG